MRSGFLLNDSGGFGTIGSAMPKSKKEKKLQPSPVSRAVIFSSGLSLLLYGLWTLWSWDNYFTFLGWNLFLALIPFGLSRYLTTRPARFSTGITFVLLIIWLAFFPNAPYLITDLIHIGERGHAVWLDILLLFSFAQTGLVIALASLYDIDQWLRTYLSERARGGMVVFFLALTSFGIYIGRYLRWNSWDIATRPFDVLRTIATTFTQTAHSTELIGFVSTFSGVLIVSYAFLLHYLKKKMPARPRLI